MPNLATEMRKITDTAIAIKKIAHSDGSVTREGLLTEFNGNEIAANQILKTALHYGIIYRYRGYYKTKGSV